MDFIRLDPLRHQVLVGLLAELAAETQSDDNLKMIQWVQLPLPEDLRRVAPEIPATCTDSRAHSPRHLGGLSAPPLTAVFELAGWVQQEHQSPWSPVSPDTVATAGKYASNPASFSWIVQND